MDLIDLSVPQTVDNALDENGPQSSFERNSSESLTGQELGSTPESMFESANQKCLSNTPESAKNCNNDNTKLHATGKFSKKAQSYQDLHSDHTKKKYQHVKSKVKQYIEEMKAQNRRKPKIIRYSSLPETLSGYNEFEDDNDDEELRKKYARIKDEMARLRSVNEFLEEKLSEKMAKVAQLRSTKTALSIEISELKEKTKLQPRPLLSADSRESESSSSDKCGLCFKGPEVYNKFDQIKDDFKAAIKNDNSVSSIMAQSTTRDENTSASTMDSMNSNKRLLRVVRRKQNRNNRRLKKGWKRLFTTFSVIPCCTVYDEFKDAYAYIPVPVKEEDAADEAL